MKNRLPEAESTLLDDALFYLHAFFLMHAWSSYLFHRQNQNYYFIAYFIILIFKRPIVADLCLVSEK